MFYCKFIQKQVPCEGLYRRLPNGQVGLICWKPGQKVNIPNLLDNLEKGLAEGRTGYWSA